MAAHAEAAPLLLLPLALPELEPDPLPELLDELDSPPLDPPPELELLELPAAPLDPAPDPVPELLDVPDPLPPDPLPPDPVPDPFPPDPLAPDPLPLEPLPLELFPEEPLLPLLLLSPPWNPGFVSLLPQALIAPTQHKAVAATSQNGAATDFADIRHSSFKSNGDSSGDALRRACQQRTRRGRKADTRCDYRRSRPGLWLIEMCACNGFRDAFVEPLPRG